MIKNVVLLFFKILRTLLYKVDRATPRRFCSDCGTKCLKQNIWISIVTSKGQAIDAYRWMKDWSYLKFFFMITCKEAFRLIILIKNVFLFGNALSICFIINFDFSVGPRFVVFDQVEMTFGIDEFIRLASSFTYNTLINKFLNILKPRTFMARSVGSDSNTQCSRIDYVTMALGVWFVALPTLIWSGRIGQI